MTTPPASPYGPPVGPAVPALPSLPTPPVPQTTVPPVTAPPLDPALPLRASRTVQGNVLAGFNKDHQIFRLLALPADSSQARAWLTELRASLAVTQDVEDWNEAFSVARKANNGADPAGLTTSWIGLSLTAAGIELLAADPRVAEELAAVPGLVDGPAARAVSLGDVGPSDPSTWLFGGPTQPVIHAVVTVAADLPSDLAAHAAALDAIDAAHGVATVFTQDGDALPGDQAGHEHFGFKDGISQPGVVGFHAAGPNGNRAGHPGTALVAAGNFIFGQPTDTGAPRPAAAWLTDGSVHVLRRLEQDVAGWRDQLTRLAATTTPPTSPDRLGALLMGRQLNGDPLAAPADPTRGLGSDGNDFTYAADSAGAVTPCPAHIRKTHLRDLNPHPRLARRGIPFGVPFDSESTQKRGLVFNCFITSITDQFEFIQSLWVNNPGFGAGGGPTGPDPVIGTPGQVHLALADGTTANLTVQQTVTTAGAVYALTLSLPTLSALAAGTSLPR